MQIIAGTPNNSAHTNSFHYAFVKGKLYLAVGVNNSVIIYSHNLTTIQVILESPFSSVSCISWQQETGKLAVCFESSTIYIYAPVFKKEANEDRIQWNKIQEIENASKTINCICWKPLIAGNCLLASGSSIVLWELTEQKDEETSIITYSYKELFRSEGNIVPVKYSSFSADGKYIVTMGEYDRFIKVWYFNQFTSRYTFVYLPHSKSVVTATWKRKKEGESSNILLTVCRNNIVRLWSESSLNDRLQFSVCCVIEPGPGTVVDWLNEPNILNTNNTSSSSTTTTTNSSNETPNLNISRYSSLVPSAGNSLDWLVSIQKNGMVIIWKVKGLSDVPKHTPNFSIWSRFSVQSAPSMSSHLRLIGLASTFSSDSRICPVKFHLYVLSSSGAINCWECIEEGSINPRISSTLINCNIGHKGTIIHTIPHNKFPYVATIDQSQRCILWKTEPNMLIDLPFLLNYITTFDNTLLFAWTPSKNIVLTSNNRGVFVYETDLISNENKTQNKIGNAPTATLMGLLADSDQFCPLLFLEVILPSSVQSSNEDHQWQIVGIPENGDQICLWTMKSMNSSGGNTSSSNSTNSIGGGSTSPEGHKSPKQTTMSFQIGQFISSYKTPSKILCVCTGSHLQYTTTTNSTKISLVTYSADNAIRFYKITDNNEIELIVTFNVDTTSPIHELHLSQHGYLAATTTSGLVNIYYLDTSSNLKLIARESLALNSTNNNNNNNNTTTNKVYSKWLNLMDGNSVLETIQDKNVILYNSKQSSKTFRSYELDWKKKEYYSTLLPGQCSTWLTDGTHICGASNQIYINTKWSPEMTSSSTLLHNYSSQSLPYPHYHPKILFEYLLSGNFKAVDYILKKLVNELNEISTSSNTNAAVKNIYQLPLEQVPVLDKTVSNDNTKLSANTSTTNTTNTNNTSSSLFSSQDQYDFLSSTTASSLSSLLTNSGVSDSIDSDSSKNSNNNNSSKVEEEQAFTVSDAKILSEYLTSISLPNVSGSEQMYLLAIIDTFSQMQSTKGGIDESGVRYLLAFKIFSFLKRSLPPADRPTSLSSADFCWALHSEAEEALLQICFPSDGTWSTARSLGIGYWLRKPTILKNFIERLAKTQFSINKDPHDCALFYLALNKKPALVALFKAVKNTAVHDFMKNDFTTDKWKTAALKNAYVLLGKQKFELAAAFFLLGGQLKDAVDICIKKLADYQLALVIARLQEGEPGPVFDYIVNTHLLPLSLQSGDYTWSSLLYWLIKKYNDSITVLLCNNNNNNNNNNEDSIKKVETKLITDPANQYLFRFLRGHTMLRDSTVNFEDINLQLLKQTSLLYRETGYSLLVPSQIKEMSQIIENKKAKSASTATTSNSSSRGGYRPFRMAFLDDEEAAPAPKKQAIETLDNALPLSIALQLLCQQIIGQNQVSLGQQQQQTSSKPVLRENFDFLSSYLQINPTTLLSNLLSFCEHRFYVRPSFDLLWEENSYATRISLLLTYCQIIYNLLSHSSHFATMSTEQLNHLYNLSSQLLECYESIKTHLNPTENLYIRVSIQVGILIYTWMNQYYSTLVHILNMKDIKSMIAKVEEDKTHAMDLSKQNELDEQVSSSTSSIATSTPTKTIAYGEVAIEYDEETIKYLDEILLLLVVRKYLNVIEGELQQTAGKAVEYFGYLNIWLYHIKQDTTDVPESFFNYIKSLKIAKESTMLSIFHEAAKKSKKYKSNINYKILWDYLAKEDLNNIFSEINFTIDVEHKATNSTTNEEPLQANKNRITHEESIVKCMDVVSLYKDKDILQSFCVNNLDNLQIAVATTRGIKEISLSKGNLFEIYEESDPVETNVGVDLPKDDSDTSRRQDAGLSNFLHKSVDKGKKVVTHSISKQIEYPVVAQWLESHPLHPYYLSGGIDGSLCLWQFNAQKENALMVTYKSSSNPRINKIHFNSRGTKFGSCDMSGKLSLWRFDANEASLRPFQILSCHTKRTLDFTFLNSGSVVASAGINYDKKNVAIWDTLKPPERSCVISFTAHEGGGASSIVYSARHQLLITGGKKGDIEIFDLRQQKLLSSIKAHSMNVKSLAIDPEQQFILTGSSEGNAKLWDLPSVTQKECWEDIHMKHTFVRKPGVFSAPVSTFGVMQVLADKEYLYSCGSDGVLKRIQYTKSL